MNYDCKICKDVIRDFTIHDEYYSIDVYQINNPKLRSKIKRITTYYICKSCFNKYIKDQNFLNKKEPIN